MKFNKLSKLIDQFDVILPQDNLLRNYQIIAFRLIVVIGNEKLLLM